MRIVGSLAAIVVSGVLLPSCTPALVYPSYQDVQHEIASAKSEGAAHKDQIIGAVDSTGEKVVRIVTEQNVMANPQLEAEFRAILEAERIANAARMESLRAANEARVGELRAELAAYKPSVMEFVNNQIAPIVESIAGVTLDLDRVDDAADDAGDEATSNGHAIDSIVSDVAGIIADVNGLRGNMIQAVTRSEELNRNAMVHAAFNDPAFKAAVVAAQPPQTDDGGIDGSEALGMLGTALVSAGGAVAYRNRTSPNNNTANRITAVEDHQRKADVYHAWVQPPPANPPPPPV